MNQKKTSEIPIQAAFVSLVHFKKIKPLYQSTPPLMTFFLSSKERTNPFYSALMFGNMIFTPQNIPCVFDYSSLLCYCLVLNMYRSRCAYILDPLLAMGNICWCTFWLVLRFSYLLMYFCFLEWNIFILLIQLSFLEVADRKKEYFVKYVSCSMYILISV